ncbi:MAG: 50S ribosomal protein L19e [Candidatus Methanogaster sp.]|nr:MAG: 50S ribosomal protein L19e [ANME-2 cluster archaeon]
MADRYDLSNQRRIAANVLKIGVNRIWLDPEEKEGIADATTRNDIRDLLESGAIKAKPKKGVSRARARQRDEKRRYGHGTGHGSRKGRKGARNPRKREWIAKIRALRSRLKELRADGTLPPNVYCKVYRKAKGGEYKSVAHMNAHLMAQGHLK